MSMNNFQCSDKALIKFKSMHIRYITQHSTHMDVMLAAPYDNWFRHIQHIKYFYDVCVMFIMTGV